MASDPIELVVNAMRNAADPVAAIYEGFPYTPADPVAEIYRGTPYRPASTFDPVPAEHTFSPNNPGNANWYKELAETRRLANQQQSGEPATMTVTQSATPRVTAEGLTVRPVQTVAIDPTTGGLQTALNKVKTAKLGTTFMEQVSNRAGIQPALRTTSIPNRLTAEPAPRVPYQPPPLPTQYGAVEVDPRTGQPPKTFRFGQPATQVASGAPIPMAANMRPQPRTAQAPVPMMRPAGLGPPKPVGLGTGGPVPPEEQTNPSVYEVLAGIQTGSIPYTSALPRNVTGALVANAPRSGVETVANAMLGTKNWNATPGQLSGASSGLVSQNGNVLGSPLMQWIMGGSGESTSEVPRFAAGGNGRVR